jgi:predicted GNAT family N-acyltransferase
MTDSDIQIEVAKWPEDRALIKDIRRKVFVIEQGVEPEIEWDGKDTNCTHLLARLGDDYIGTGRIAPNGHIGRLSVLTSHRDRGVGRALLQRLIDIAREQGHSIAFLNAQVQAVGFYEQYGFVEEGKVFMVAGIPHQRMELNIEHLESATDNILEQSLVHGLEDNYQALLELCYMARYSIEIFTPDLDRRLLSRGAFIQTLKGFIRISPKSRIRVLVSDPTSAIRYDHQLIELSQEFSSYIEIRKTHDDYRHLPYSYILIDGKASLYRPNASEYDAKLSLSDAPAGRKLQTEFMEIWNLSQVVPGIKRLFI